MEGYVLTQYLDDITLYDLEAAEANGTADLEIDVAEPINAPNFTTSPENFHEGYYAYAVKNAVIYLEPNELSRKIGSVPIYDQVIVSEVSGEWCLARYEDTCGFIRTSSLFKWDRIDPYVGEIPGLDIMPYLAFVNHTTTIYSMEDDSVLKTINPGAAIAVFELDEEGRYPLPYWRTTGYIKEEDVALARAGQGLGNRRKRRSDQHHEHLLCRGHLLRAVSGPQLEYPPFLQHDHRHHSPARRRI